MGVEDEKIEAFVASWGLSPPESVAWEARAMVDELSKSGRHSEAIDLGERALSVWPGFAPLGSCVGWAYFRRDVTGVDGDSDGPSLARARKAQRRIVELPTSDPYGKFSAIPLTTLMVARAVMARNPAEAVDLLESLNPDHLSTVSGQYRSQYSQWFTLLAKSLAEAQRWEALLNLTGNLERAPNLTIADVESISWNRVRGLESVGRTQEAVDLLARLRRSRSQWWFDACQARLSESLGAEDDAISFARMTLNHPGDLAPRWSTVAQLGRLLSDRDPELAGDHLLVAQALRREKGWRPDPDLTELIGTRGLGELDQDRFAEVMARLRVGWRIVEEETLSSGTIKTLLPGGGSGFITDDDGGDVYFSMGKNGGEAPAVGTRVSFRVVESFDQKKQQASTRAVRVQPLG